MPASCLDVVQVLLFLVVFVVSFEADSSTKTTPACSVQPMVTTNDDDDRSVAPSGDCQCSTLNEIRCRGLNAVPQIDLQAVYAGRQTYRSLYLASQHIRRLPAGAFATLNVRRIVLDFNPIGDRIDPRAFSGTVDAVELAHLHRLVLRQRRTSRSDGGSGGPGGGSNFNASSSKDVETRLTDDEQRTITAKSRHGRHRQSASKNFNTSVETKRRRLVEQSRRYDYLKFITGHLWRSAFNLQMYVYCIDRAYLLPRSAYYMKRSITTVSCPSVCNVDVSWPHNRVSLLVNKWAK